MATITNTIRWADDTAQLKARILEGIGTIDAMKQSVDRAAASMGGQGLFAQANKLTAAVDQLGGVTKLTTAEKDRLNATLTKAIEKYEAMGMKAPPAMAQLAEATKRVVDPSEVLAAKLDTVKERLTSFASGAKTVGLGLTAAITAPILAVGAAAIKLGMDAVESENLVAVSFGDMKGKADDWAANLSKNLGLNRFESEKTAGVLFNMTTSMGLGRNAAFDMSTGVVKLAADMSSFRNIPMEEALTKIKSGLTGEAEPLKAIGILVDDNTIKTYAYKEGIAAQGSELTQQQKVMARWGAILQQTSNDQGDLARTLDSPANQLRLMKTRVEEAATSLGVALMPMVQSVIGGVSQLVPYIQQAVEWFADLPAPVKLGAVAIAAVAAAAGPVIYVLGSMASAITTLIPLYTAAATSAGVLGTATTILGGTMTFLWTTMLPIAATVAGIYAAFKIGQTQAVSDTFEYLGLRLQGVSSELARVTINSRRAAEAHAESVTPVADLGAETTRLKDEMTKEIAAQRAAAEKTSAHVDAQKAAIKAAEEQAKALKSVRDALNVAVGGSKALTIEQASLATSALAAGVAAGTVAKAYGLNEIAVTQLSDAIKQTKDNTDWLNKRSQGLATEGLSILRSATVELTKQSSDSLSKLLDVWTQYGEKIEDQTLKGTALQIAQLERARRAAIASLEERTAQNAAFYDRDKQQIDVYYNFQITKAQTWVEKAKALDVDLSTKTKVELDRAAEAARLAYADMTQSGRYSAEQLVEALRKVEQAEYEASTGAARLGRDLKDGLTGVLLGIPGTLAQAFTGGGDLLGAAKAIGSQIGATIGGSVGLAFGGPMGKAVGEAVGSLVGPLIGMIAGLFGKHTEKDVFRTVGAEWGVEISDGLRDQIAKDAKALGSEVAAISLNMGKIFSEAGGIAAFGVEKATSKVRDLFALIDQGHMTAAQAVKTLDEVFPELATAATDAYGLISPQLREIIDLNDRFGTNSKAIADFMKGQLTDAAGGLNELFSGVQASADESFRQTIEARKQAGDALTGEAKRDFDVMIATQEKYVSDGQVLWLKSEQQARGFSAAVVGTFGEMVKRGMSTGEALKALDPAIATLTKQLQGTGFSGGEAFAQISAMSDIAKDKITGPMIDAVSGANRALVGLQNTGILNQEMFGALSGTAVDAYQTIVAQGKDGDAALRMMQPTLQTVWELQQEFGYSVDDATQNLIDQGVKAGILGEKHRDVQSQIKDALDKVVDVLDRIADKLGANGGGLVSAFGGVNDAVETNGRAWNDWSTKTGGAIETATTKVADLSRTVSTTARDFIDDFGDMKDAVDTFTWGDSPDGLWYPEVLLRSLRTTTTDVTRDMAGRMTYVKAAVDGVSNALDGTQTAVRAAEEVIVSQAGRRITDTFDAIRDGVAETGRRIHEDFGVPFMSEIDAVTQHVTDALHVGGWTLINGQWVLDMVTRTSTIGVSAPGPTLPGPAPLPAEPPSLPGPRLPGPVPLPGGATGGYTNWPGPMIPEGFGIFEQPGPLAFANGTPNLDYVDFGRGTLAMLHGREKVVPEGRQSQSDDRAADERFARLEGEVRGLRRDLMRALPQAVFVAVRDGQAQARAGRR